MTNLNEEWKAVVGFEGLYEVSNLGRVRSLDKEVDSGKGYYFKKGRILKPGINRHGRLHVTLSKDGKQYKKTPHSLVALAFIGERPEGYHVCHIDGDCLNNELSNIRFDTASQNAIDIYRQGSKQGLSKLSIEQVLEIRRLYARGEYTQTELGRMFNMGRIGINRIVNRKTFSWLNDDGTIQDSTTSVS